MENQIVELGFTPYGCSPEKTYYAYQIVDMSMYKKHPDGMNTYCSIYVSEIPTAQIGVKRTLEYDKDIYLLELVTGRYVVCLIDHISKNDILTSFFNPDYSSEIIPVNKIQRAFIVEVISKRVKDYLEEAKAIIPTKDRLKPLTGQRVRELLNNADTEKQMTEAILLIEQTYRPYVYLDWNGRKEMGAWLNTMLMGHFAVTSEYVEMVEEFNKLIAKVKPL